jgi:hypothetical protein
VPRAIRRLGRSVLGAMLRMPALVLLSVGAIAVSPLVIAVAAVTAVITAWRKRRFLRIRGWRDVLGALGGLALAIFLVAISPVLFLAFMPEIARKWWRHRRFLRTQRGKVFFLWHARRGWYDFVRNNVLPVLPAHVRALHDRRRGGDELRAVRDALARAHEPWIHPTLVVVGTQRVHAFNLNQMLQEKKMLARRDVAAQADVRKMLNRALVEHATRVEEIERPAHAR